MMHSPYPSVLNTYRHKCSEPCFQTLSLSSLSSPFFNIYKISIYIKLLEAATLDNKHQAQDIPSLCTLLSNTLLIISVAFFLCFISFTEVSITYRCEEAMKNSRRFCEEIPQVTFPLFRPTIV